jgi:WD40 repeat protein
MADPVQSPDGSRVALSVDSGQIFVFDLASSALTSTYTSHAMAVRSLSWSPDSQVRAHAYITHVADPRCSFSSQLLRTSALSCMTCVQRHLAGQALGR